MNPTWSKVMDSRRRDALGQLAHGFHGFGGFDLVSEAPTA